MINKPSAKAERDARAQKVQQLRQAQAARDRRQRILLCGSVSVVVLALIGGTTLVLVRETAGRSLAGVKSSTQEAGHVTTAVTYPQTPPAGGQHDPTWLNCGIYDQPVRNENAVHDLEHGAVWITYRPDLPATDIAALRQIAGGQTYLVLSPYPELPAPVVVSGWGKQLPLTGASDKRLPEFIRTYRQGPNAPESGASCTGGTGTPT
ncbi:DUF3105 domain-containing protein [Kineosporia sp. R_H_3]|uniref:DUF3105 domain-containing protein n=1 Tax=Kineosporia sp. R_H_3 TaxID=1961848 RepID=UPI0018E9EF89|nr:DUF3105 domain-containing protein [Kineosporia sp. R_H_3]